MDPLEQYLAKKAAPTDSDPLAAYLANKSGGQAVDEPPPAFLTPGHRREPSGRQFNNTGPDAAGQLRREAADIPEPSVAEAITAPFHSMANAATAGGYGAALRLGARVVPGLDAGADAADHYRADNPTISQFTDAPAYFAKRTPIGMLSESIGAGLGAVTRSAPKAVSRVLSSRPVAGAVSGGLTAGSGTAAQTMAEGGRPSEALHSGGRAALIGAGLGAGVGTVAGALEKGADIVRNSKGGQARRFVEQHGGTVRPGGVDLPEGYVTQGTTDADIGAQAEASASNGLQMLNKQGKAVKRSIGRNYNVIAHTPEAQQLHDVTDIVARLREASQELDTAPQARAALEDTLKVIHGKQGQGFNPETDNYFLSETDVNKLRRQLGRFGKVGTSTDEALGPIQRAAGGVKGIVDEGPYADTNKRYAETSADTQESRRMLGINERPKTPDESKAAVNTVRHLIERPGQNTITAGGQQGHLAEFNAKHPDIADEFAKPEVLRKRADLSFHVAPQHGGLIQRTAGAIGGPAAVLIAAGLGHGLKGAGLAAAILAAQNAQPIAGRLLYPLAEGVRMGGTPTRLGQAVRPLSLSETRRRRTEQTP